MVMGQPPKITENWAFIESLVLAERFRGGESVAEVCLELDICRDSFYKAVRISSEFKAAYELGKHYSEAWWTKLGRAGAAGKVKIQPATWVFNMKNRFDWKDKTESEITGKDGGPIETRTKLTVEDYREARQKMIDDDDC